MFNKISIENVSTINLPIESSLVNISAFNDFETDFVFRSFSMKYVIEGCENYKIEGSNYKLKKGDYLLANNFKGGSVKIESHSLVKGLCIDISPKIISDVALSYKYPDVIEDKSEIDAFFSSNLYPENKYHTTENTLGKKLLSISENISKNIDYSFEFTNEFYYDLAENLISDQYLFSRQIATIKSIKAQTKKEIFKKINEGKLYIENHFLTIKSIQEIAIYCSMSEYHFFRVFKQVYKISPYQFLNHKKLNYALKLLDNSDLSISEIAFLTGFIDLPTFSKNFKKTFAMSPSNYKKAVFDK